MCKTKNLCLGAVLCALCLFGHEAGAAQTILALDITNLATGANGEGVYVTTSESTTSTDGCGPQFVVLSSNTMFDVIVSTLLTAQSTGKKINAYVTGCYSSQMILKAVTIY